MTIQSIIMPDGTPYTYTLDGPVHITSSKAMRAFLPAVIPCNWIPMFARADRLFGWLWATAIYPDDPKYPEDGDGEVMAHLVQEEFAPDVLRSSSVESNYIFISHEYQVFIRAETPGAFADLTEWIW